MTKVGILSDTHGWLRDEVKQQLSDCDYIIHAGDIDNLEIIEELRQIAPCYIVRGNADKTLPVELKEWEAFVIDGVHFELIHNKKMLPVCNAKTQVVVYGHTHKYVAKRDEKGVLWLNPGCCGKRRVHQEVTMMKVSLDQGNLDVKKVILEQENATQDALLEQEQKDLLVIIEEIVKRMDRNEPMEKIAHRIKRPTEFVEMIYRIKVTHPGVTSMGIYNKLEANETVTKWKKK